MSTNYTNKQINYVIGNESGFDDGSNTLTLTNLKSTLTTGSYGNAAGVSATVTLTGLSLTLLSQLAGKGIGIWVPNPYK